VERVRSIGRDRGIPLRRQQSPRCQRRNVVGVDDVMCEAGMFWFLREQGFEDRTGFQPARVSLSLGCSDAASARA